MKQMDQYNFANTDSIAKTNSAFCRQPIKRDCCCCCSGPLERLPSPLRELHNEDAFKSALKHYILNNILISEVTVG